MNSSLWEPVTSFSPSSRATVESQRVSSWMGSIDYAWSDRSVCQGWTCCLQDTGTHISRGGHILGPGTHISRGGHIMGPGTHISRGGHILGTGTHISRGGHILGPGTHISRGGHTLGRRSVFEDMLVYAILCPLCHVLLVKHWAKHRASSHEVTSFFRLYLEERADKC